MINNYDSITFSDNNMVIKGTSYNYGGTYDKPNYITRTLILENTTTYETFNLIYLLLIMEAML